MVIRVRKRRRSDSAYRNGVEWIALNDEPRQMDPVKVGQFITSVMLAAICGKEPAQVGQDVVAYRKDLTESKDG